MANTAAILEHKARVETVDIGLDAKYCKEMSGSLTGILADTYKLMIKSHIYHWNVVGPLFKPLHELTEEHYETLFEATDILAERIRALGQLAPNKFSEAAAFSPSAGEVNKLTAADMLDDLIEEHRAVVKTMREAAGKAGDADDVVTEDMLTARLTFHEKALWMLRAINA